MPTFDDLAVAAASGRVSRRRVLTLLAGSFVATAWSAAGPRTATASAATNGRTESPSAQADPCAKGDRVDWTPQCQHPVTKIGYVNSYNGCGPAQGLLQKVLPDFPMGANFRSACNNHDLCYGTCGSNKGTCDSKFQKALQTACAQKFSGHDPVSKIQLGICSTLADDYWSAVVLGGQGAFDSAQKEACDCCACDTGCDGCSFCDTSKNVNGTCSTSGTGAHCIVNGVCYANPSTCFSVCPFTNIDWCSCVSCTPTG
jgi:hypothetical protein